MKTGATLSVEEEPGEYVVPSKPRASMDFLKQMLGLPPDAECRGFGLMHVATGAYLFRSCDSPDQSACGWSEAPDDAILFRNWPDALVAAAARPDGVIVIMFDVGDEIIVFPAR
jgi:hypothetical protein